MPDLFSDWYELNVAPRKRQAGVGGLDVPITFPAAPKPILSNLPGPLTTPAEMSTTSPQPATAPTVLPSTSIMDSVNPGSPTQPDAGESSWSDRLSKGLQDPAKMGLLGMGLSMMATPPRRQPYSAGEIVGGAGLTGLKFFQQAVDDKRRAETMALSAEEHRLNREDQKLYRQGVLDDRAAQRRIQEESAASLKAQREAAAELTSSLNEPVSDAYWKAIGRPELIGSGITNRQLQAASSALNAAGAQQGKLVPVKQSDGAIVYERRTDAVGQEVPQKPEQKYRNVPGVGMVDISGPEPVVKIKAPVIGKGGRGAGGKPTANIQNIEYLVGNGWNRKDAEDVVLHGKRMPRENFIANMTKSIYGNEFISDEDKPKKMEEAIKFYDSTIPQRGEKKPATQGKVLDQATATSILKEAGGDKDKARKIAKERGYTF